MTSLDLPEIRELIAPYLSTHDKTYWIKCLTWEVDDNTLNQLAQKYLYLERLSVGIFPRITAAIGLPMTLELNPILTHIELANIALDNPALNMLSVEMQPRLRHLRVHDSHLPKAKTHYYHSMDL
ncbi:hypothetical protein BG011_000002 [Mortierella polycephala]|uniref:Uncharacterized protein n=1 Tax=Mortierella polycephala TaxID=41804 RepID=A0A9P6QFT0_9FUNG|nr:hypothetical protein BG011_000002 [Mortierella polycephala]